MICKINWLSMLALGWLVACSSGEGSPGEPPAEPGRAPIAENLPAEDSETPPADDQAPPVDDQAAPFGDQTSSGANEAEEQEPEDREPEDREPVASCTPEGGCVCSDACEACLCAAGDSSDACDILCG